MTYDKAVYALATDFIGDKPHLDNEAARVDLAKAIQSAIEDFIDQRAVLHRRGLTEADIAFRRDFFRF